MKVSYFRIISIIITITLLFQPLSVFASGDDTVSSENVDDFISEFANNIKNNTVEFFTTYNIEIDSVDSLWTGFIATWKITKASAYYGLSSAKLCAGLLKDFIEYLRDNYFYYYFENDKEYHYISPSGRLPEHNRPIGTKPSSINYGTYSGVFGYVDDFHGSFPVQSSNESTYFAKYVIAPYPIGDIVKNRSLGDYSCGVANFNTRTESRSSYNIYAKIVVPDLTGITLQEGQFLLNLTGYLGGGRYIDQSRFAVCHIDNDNYLNIDNIITNFSVINNHFYVNLDYYSQPTTGILQDDSGSFTTNYMPNSPYHLLDYIFYDLYWGDGLYQTADQFYFYHNNVLTDISEFNNTISLDLHSKISLGSVQQPNTTVIDNAINNYNTVINNTINNYPSITPDMLLYILNDYLSKILDGVDISDYLEDLADRISQLEEQLQQELEDLHNIKSTLVKVKNYLKSIDDNISHIMEKFDSLFLNSGIFFLDVKLDYLYNHLSSDITSNTNRIISAIQNISISSNGGSSGDINFGDFIIDLDITLTNLFTLNNEQKAELESDIDTIKSPFVWVATLGNNINSLLSSMVRRSAQYSGDSYTNDFSSLNDAFSSVSDNAPVPPGTDTSVPGGSAALSSDSQSNTPSLIVHLGNANSDINYGGDVSVLDFSWYAPYKPLVDNIIVIFAWAFFIIIFFRRLPSFIHGDDAKEEG